MNFDWVFMADRPYMYDEISFFFIIIIIIFWDKRLEYDEISYAPLICFYLVRTLFDSSSDLEPSFRITFDEIF